MNRRILSRLASLFINKKKDSDFYIDYGEDDYYDINYISLLSVRNKNSYKICHIDIDKHGVRGEHMLKLGNIDKSEQRKVKIYRRVRQKNSYMNYPFYCSKT